MDRRTVLKGLGAIAVTLSAPVVMAGGVQVNGARDLFYPGVITLRKVSATKWIVYGDTTGLTI